MINWELIEPRNLLIVAILALVAIYVYNHFAAKLGGDGSK